MTPRKNTSDAILVFNGDFMGDFFQSLVTNEKYPLMKTATDIINCALADDILSSKEAAYILRS